MTPEQRAYRLGQEMRCVVSTVYNWILSIFKTRRINTTVHSNCIVFEIVDGRHAQKVVVPDGYLVATALAVAASSERSRPLKISFSRDGKATDSVSIPTWAKRRIRRQLAFLALQRDQRFNMEIENMEDNGYAG